MLVWKKFHFLEEDWTLGHILWRFDIFLILPNLLRSYEWGNSYIQCLLLIITLFFTCGEKNIWLNMGKSQNIMSMIEDSECVSSASLAIFLALFLWLIIYHVTRDLMAAKKTCVDLISIPFFLVLIFYIYFFFYFFIFLFFFFFFFVYLPNLKLDNIKQ